MLLSIIGAHTHTHTHSHTHSTLILSYLAVNDLPVPLINTREVNLTHKLNQRWTARVLVRARDMQLIESVVKRCTLRPDD